MAMTNIFAKPATQENNADRLMDDGARAGRGAPRPNPEVVGRAKRRRFTAAYKLKVLAGADAGKDWRFTAPRRTVLFASDEVAAGAQSRNPPGPDSAEARPEVEGECRDGGESNAAARKRTAD